MLYIYMTQFENILFVKIEILGDRPFSHYSAKFEVWDTFWICWCYQPNVMECHFDWTHFGWCFEPLNINLKTNLKKKKKKNIFHTLLKKFPPPPQLLNFVGRKTRLYRPQNLFIILLGGAESEFEVNIDEKWSPDLNK